MTSRTADKIKPKIGTRTGNSTKYQMYFAPRDMAALKSMAIVNNTTVADIIRQQMKRYLARVNAIVDEEAA